MPPTAVLAVAVVLAQITGGAILWTWIRRKDSPPPLIELVGMGIAIGSLLAVTGSQITINLNLGGTGWLLPIVMAAVVLVYKPAQWRVLCSIPRGSVFQWIVVSTVAGFGLVTLLPGLQRTPIFDGYVTGSSYHGDLVFLEAVSQFLAEGGPNESSLLAGFGIRYHWLTYGWIGSLTDVINAEPFFVMTRIFPILMILGGSFLSVAWATRLSRRIWTPLIAGLLVVVAGYVGAEQGVIFNFDSPSTAYAAILALAFGLALTDFLDPQHDSESPTWPYLVALGGIAAGSMGAKASQAAVIFVGLLFMCVVSPRVPGPLRRKIWLTVAASCLGMLAAYLIFFRGVAPSETNIGFSLVGEKVSSFQGLDPFEGTFGALLGTLALSLAVLPRWAGVPWIVGPRQSPSSPGFAFSAGVAVAGLAPLFLLTSGTNAGWFAVAASPILGVVSAVGLERAWERISGLTMRLALLCAAAALAVDTAVFIAFSLGAVSGAPVFWRGPVLAWLLALLLSLAIAGQIRSRHPFRVRWLVACTTVLVLASIGARFSGSAMWSMTQSSLTAYAQAFVRWTDPQAQFFPNSSTLTRDPIDGQGLAGLQTELVGGPASGSTVLGQWSPQLNASANWLEQRVGPDALVAVDATYLQPFLPVVTDLTMYVAGEPYVSGYTTPDGVEAAAARQNLTRSFLSDPTHTKAQRLWMDGVRWLWLQETPSSEIDQLSEWAPIAFKSDSVTILKLNDADASSE